MVQNVVLIGFMGTGKTSVGKMLATKLGRGFIDLDQYIEEEQGLTIPQIFQVYGETYFRKCEREAVASLAHKRGTVIATGGGTVKNPENLRTLKEGGVLIALTADVETILSRTENRPSRPLLNTGGEGGREALRAKIEDLLAQRQSLYSQADYTVDTSDKSPLLVVEDIIRHLRIRS